MTLRNTSAHWAGRGPLFVACAHAAFDMAPANVSRMVDQLEPEFEIVRPGTWFELVRSVASKHTDSVS